jgi:hypothetical protein
MIIYAADHPLVLNGTYDVEGYKPGERARIAKAKAHQESLTPTSDAPSRSARWCPRCRAWIEAHGKRRCETCGTAVVRQLKAEKSIPGELRPGVAPEFDDERDQVESKGAETDMAKKRTKKTPTHRVNTHSARNPPSSRQVAPPGKKKHPRSRPLPGLENVRIDELDECATSISEIREQMNELRAQETDQLKIALGVMRANKKTSWRHAGVELVRVPGEEKLRVRTSKQAATAETEEEPDDEQVEVSAPDEAENDGNAGAGAAAGTSGAEAEADR